jgi:hypothetical protein
MPQCRRPAAPRGLEESSTHLPRVSGRWQNRPPEALWGPTHPPLGSPPG